MSTINPAEELDGPRLLMCYDCGVLTKLPPPPHSGVLQSGEDPALDRVVMDHQHLSIPEHARKGGRLFPTTQKTWDRMDVVTQVKTELAKNQIWVQNYKDQVVEDALACFRKHHSPEWPGKPCIDYKSEEKRLGGPGRVRKGLAILLDKQKLQYLCTYCPYESTVTTQKRWDRGDYNE